MIAKGVKEGSLIFLAVRCKAIESGGSSSESLRHVMCRSRCLTFPVLLQSEAMLQQTGGQAGEISDFKFKIVCI